MNRPIILSGFQCTGSEGNLLGCSRYDVNSIHCSHGSDVGVQCPGVYIHNIIRGSYNVLICMN